MVVDNQIIFKRNLCTQKNVDFLFFCIETSRASWLRELESENTKLMQLLAEAHLNVHQFISAFGVKR